MAQLRIEQVAAPDFSSVSDMLRNVNQSFNTGIESAKGILEKYNEGQQAKGDQALVGALAGLKSEEELANFLQTTDLASMNISDKMRENILGARATILGNDSTRDSISRANALEGRQAAEYADGEVVVLTVEPGTANEATFVGKKDVGSNQFIECIWTEGNTAVGHDAGSTIIDYDSATHYNLLSKALQGIMNQDGTLKYDPIADALGLGSTDLNGWEVAPYTFSVSFTLSFST